MLNNSIHRYSLPDLPFSQQNSTAEQLTLSPKLIKSGRDRQGRQCLTVTNYNGNTFFMPIPNGSSPIIEGLMARKILTLKSMRNETYLSSKQPVIKMTPHLLEIEKKIKLQQSLKPKKCFSVRQDKNGAKLIYVNLNGSRFTMPLPRGDSIFIDALMSRKQQQIKPPMNKFVIKPDKIYFHLSNIDPGESEC